MAYSTVNPCLCTPPTTCDTPTTPSCATGECICFCDILILPTDIEAVACGQAGTISLLGQESDTTACGETTPVFTLLGFDGTFFSNAFIDTIDIISSVTLTWVPLEGAPNVTGNIVFQVSCGDLAKIVTVTIGRKNLCLNVVCPDGQICEECTGNCVEDPSGFGNIVVEINE